MPLETPYPQPRRREYPEVGSPDVRRKIAQELHSAREFNEMSLEQVSAITKINSLFLDNLEKGHWSFLPPVYIKLFLRAYAQVVGIATEEFNNRLNDIFYAIKPQMSIPEDDPFSSFSPYRAVRPKGPLAWMERNRATVFYGVIIMVAVVLVGWYLIKRPESIPITADRQDSAAAAELSSPDTGKKTTAAPVVPSPSDTLPKGTLGVISDSTTAAVDSTLFQPLIIVEDYCYLRIEKGDSVIYDRTLWPGNRYCEKLPYPVRVILGNASAVQISVGGLTLPRFPPEPRVRTIELGPEGIVAPPDATPPVN